MYAARMGLRLLFPSFQTLCVQGERAKKNTLPKGKGVLASWIGGVAFADPETSHEINT